MAQMKFCKKQKILRNKKLNFGIGQTDYNYLKHYGENYYQTVDGATQKAATATVQSGYLEASNVQVVKEMVELISVTRAYESNQKLVQTIDGTLDVAANQLGRV